MPLSSHISDGWNTPTSCTESCWPKSFHIYRRSVFTRFSISRIYTSMNSEPLVPLSRLNTVRPYRFSSFRRRFPHTYRSHHSTVQVCPSRSSPLLSSPPKPNLPTKVRALTHAPSARSWTPRSEPQVMMYHLGTHIPASDLLSESAVMSR